MGNAEKHVSAEFTLRKMIGAAKALGASKEIQADLQSLEQTIAEVRHYATTSVAQSGCLSADAASRLLTYVLGIDVKVTGIGAGYNDTQRYAAENC